MPSKERLPRWRPGGYRCACPFSLSSEIFLAGTYSAILPTSGSSGNAFPSSWVPILDWESTVKNIRLIATTVLVSLLAFLTGSPGDLQGKVSESTGGSIPGATVTVIDQSSGQQRRATADSEGRYLFPNLAGGEYLLEVEFSGFRKFVTELTIHGATTQRNIVDGGGAFHRSDHGDGDTHTHARQPGGAQRFDHYR